MDIKHRITGAVLRVVEGANLRGAKLSGADLSGAKLSDAPIIDTPTYTTRVMGEYLIIGCKTHTFEQWSQFTDDEIGVMDKKALEFWKEWSSKLLAYAPQ